MSRFGSDTASVRELNLSTSLTLHEYEPKARLFIPSPIGSKDLSVRLAV